MKHISSGFISGSYIPAQIGFLIIEIGRLIEKIIIEGNSTEQDERFLNTGESICGNWEEVVFW